MRNCANAILGKGWEDTVVTHLSNIKDLGAWSLAKLKDFAFNLALYVARKMDISHDGSVLDVLTRLFTRESVIGMITHLILTTGTENLGEVAASTAASATRSTATTVLSAVAGVDTVFFAASTAYSCYQYKNGNITKTDLKKHVTKRAVATVGSIAGTTIGALVGTAICPGVGTFLGGVIGGMAGDFFGSKAGEAAYDKISTPNNTKEKDE